MIVKVRALRTHPYAGTYRRPGQEYDILKPKDLKILAAVGMVEVVIDEVVPPVAQPDEREVKVLEEDEVETKKTYSRKDVTAESKPKTKKTYSRRDLHATTREDSESPPGEE